MTVQRHQRAGGGSDPPTTFALLFLSEGPEYYTKDIVGVATEDDFRTPGLIGYLYLAGGGVGAMIGLCLAVSSLALLWHRMARWHSAVLGQGLLASTLPGLLSESAMRDMVRAILCAAVIEILARSWAPRTLPASIASQPTPRHDRLRGRGGSSLSVGHLIRR